MENILGSDFNDFEFDNSLADHAIETTDASTQPAYTDPESSFSADPVQNPTEPNSNSFLNAVNIMDNKFNQERLRGPIETGGYDPDIKERFKDFPGIYNDNFDPRIDHERVAYENWDKWDALATGWAGFKDNFSAAFAETAYVWPRTAAALLTMNTDYLTPSEDRIAELGRMQAQSRLDNPLFLGPGESQDDFLTKSFLAETLQNLGFTFGTLGELGAEWAATAVISRVNPFAAGAAVVAQGQRTNKVMNFLSGLFSKSAIDDVARATADDATRMATQTGFETGGSRYIIGQPYSKLGKSNLENLRLMNASSNVGLNGVKLGVDVWDNALNIASKVPFLGSVADAGRVMRQARGAGLTTAELAKIGAGGLRRSFAEWQMAAGEAAIEAGGTYNEFLTRMMDYQSEGGKKEVTGEQFLEMRNLALQSATAAYGTNVAILGISNKLMFGNMLGKFGLDSRLLSQLKNSIGGGLAKELGIKTVVSKGVPKHYQLKGFQGLFGTFGIANQIRNDFGSKVMAWELGKSTLRGVTNFQVVEGLQENIQEGTNHYLLDYYGDIYKGDPASWGKSFEEAIDSQMTKQGAKVFLMGAMTGMFVNPVVNSVQYSKNLVGDKSHQESIGRTIDILNNFYKSDSKTILSEHVKNIKLQTEYAENMRDAVGSGNKMQYFNNKDSALIQAVMHAKRTGTMDYMTEFLNGYGDNFSPTEFQEAFGYSPQDLGKSSPKEVMDEIAGNVKRYSDLYDKYQTKYGLMLSLDQYMGDDAGRMKYSIRKAALMDAITTVAFAEAKGQQSTIRSEEILRRLSSLPSIGNSLSSSFNTIISPDEIRDNMLVLNNEIKTLEEGTDKSPRVLEMIKDKKREKELLETMEKDMYEVVEEEDPNDATKIIRYTVPKKTRVKSEMDSAASVLSEYLEIKNRQNGINTAVNQQEVRDALNDIYDYVTLGRDHNEYIQAVNLLSDPDNFTKYYENIMDARAGAHARRLYEDYQEMGKISEVGKNFIETPEVKKLMDDLLAFSKTPYGTYNNYSKLQKIMDEVVKKKDELVLGKLQEIFAEQVEQDKKKTEERIKQERILQSKSPVNIEELYNNPDTLQQAEEYMAMRYDFEDLANNFPFESTDLSQRKVTRYYLHPDGTRIAFEKQITVHTEYDLYQTGELVPIDNMEILKEYLKIREQMNYDVSLRETPTSQQTDEKTEQIDDEKAKLANHVGNTVVVAGNTGTLQMNEDGGFYVEYPDGTRTELPDSNEESSFNDYTDISPAYPLLPEEDKELISPTSNPVVESTESGEMTIDYVVDVEDGVKSVKSIIINGVVWNIEYNDKGEITGFVRDYERKKGNKTRMVRERLKLAEPYDLTYGPKQEAKYVGYRTASERKAQQYAALVNSHLQLTMADIPESIEEMQEMSDILDQAIAAVDNIIETESVEQRTRREIVDQFKLNKIINVNTPENITLLRTKFGNPETRSQMTQDELVELALWASDLRKSIKKNWSIYINNPIVNGYLTQLTKEYINPIDQLLTEQDKKDGTRGQKQRTATRRNTTKKERAEKSAKADKSGKRKPGAETVQGEPATKKGRKRKSVAEAIDQVEKTAEKKRKKAARSQREGVTADKVQKVSLRNDTKKINKIGVRKISRIQDSIRNSDSTLLRDPNVNPFSSLNSNSTYCE
jgi:hypothetical protein